MVRNQLPARVVDRGLIYISVHIPFECFRFNTETIKAVKMTNL